MTPPFFVAYLDPGTGSYVLQMALAGLLGASYAVKHFWSRMKAIVRGKGNGDVHGGDASSPRRDGNA